MTLSKAEQKKREQRERDNKRKREWRAKKKKIEARLKHAHDGLPIQASSIMRLQEGARPEELPTYSRPNEKTYSETEVRELLKKALTMKDEDYKEPEPPRQSRAERRWMKKKEKLRRQLAEMSDEPPEEYKHPVTIEQAEEITKKETHFKGKRPLQFKKDQPAPPVKAAAEQVEPKPEPASYPADEEPHRRRLRWRSKKTKELFTELVPEAQPPMDVVTEQVEKPQTSLFCPESVKEDGIKEVKRNPEQYIEINMVTKSRVVDTFYIASDRKSFHYKKKEYRISEDTIYLLPTRLGMFMPTCHYKEDVLSPWGFRQMNRGITGKALSLLYMEQLYTSLLYSEDVKYNVFIVILSIAILIAYAVGCYFLFAHEGGLFKSPVPLPQIQTIIPWRL